MNNDLPTPVPASSPIVNAAADMGAQIPQDEPWNLVGAYAGGMFEWADNMDDRGRSIVRQVAFKEVPNKDEKTPEQIWYLTNLYESIMTGSYIPDQDDTDNFIETAQTI